VLAALALGLAGPAAGATAVQPDGAPLESLPGVFDPGAGAASLGAADAPVVVIEFVDYRCGFCARQARAAFDLIRERFIEPGLVRYLAVELPLLGPEAERDALVARCAGEQGGYWAVHRALLQEAEFPREGTLEIGPLAAAAGLDAGRLSYCLESGRQLSPLRDGAQRATAYRVEATPAFLFGFPVDGGTAMSVERHLVGAVGATPAIEAIEALLRSLDERLRRERVDR
jgi:protein-disulfide isomerase